MPKPEATLSESYQTAVKDLKKELLSMVEEAEVSEEIRHKERSTELREIRSHIEKL